MRFSRLAAGTVSAGLLGLTPSAIASPGHAAGTWTTTTVAAPDVTELVIGDELVVTVDVDASNGLVPDGTSTLLALEAGASAWAPVATNTSSGGDFFDVRPTTNTTYKVAYAGWTDPDTVNGDSYTASESAPFTVGVARRITLPESGFVLRGKVTPDYARKKITIRASRRIDRGYRAFTTTRTDRRGKYEVTLPKRRGRWYWLVSTRSDSTYLANSYVWETLIS